MTPWFRKSPWKSLHRVHRLLPDSCDPSRHNEEQLPLTSHYDSGLTDIPDREYGMDEFRSKIDSLQNELQHARTTIRQHEQELSRQRETFDRQSRDNARKFNSLANEHHELLEKVEKDRTKQHEVEQKFQDEMCSIRAKADAMIETARQDALVARSQHQEAELKCEKLKQENKSQKATIFALQASALRSVESTRWAPLACNDIEHEIKHILGNIRWWSVRYFDVSIEQTLEMDLFLKLASSLTRHQCIESPEQLRHALAANVPMQKGNRAVAMLLQAAVSSSIFNKFLGVPFHAFVGNSEVDGLLHQQDGAAIDRVYHLLRAEDQSGAEAWRYQVLRLLDTTPIATDSRITAGASFVDDFIAEWFAPGSSVPQDLRTALLEITEKAVELARQLWTRKPRIVVMDFVTLKNHLYPQSPLIFNGNKELLDHHTAYSSKLEDDPQALDGHEVIMVCSPAVVAFGDAKGEEYDNFRVLKKAVVWMG